jgi:hypothetical protein
MTNAAMSATNETPVMQRQILLVGPYGVLGTGVIDALAASNVPIQRVVLAGGAKSYGFSLGAFNAPAKETDPRLGLPLRFPGTKRQSAQRNLQYIERRRLSLEATVE